MTIKAIITDLDNTLFASDSYARDLINETGNLLGIDVPTEQRIREVQKKNLAFEEVFNQLFESNSTNVLAKYRELAKTKPYYATPYAIETVNSLLKNGLIIGAVTNRTNLVNERLEQCDFHREKFAFVYTPASKEFAKPHPMAYDLAIKDLAVKNVLESEIIVVGDHSYDYLSAKARNLYFAAVLTGETSRDEFKKEGLEEKFILNDLSGLPGLLIDL